MHGTSTIRRTSATWQGRAGGAVLALAVQALFLLAMMLSTTRHGEQLRETILHLNPLPPVPPRTIDARGTPARRAAPVQRPAAPAPAAPMPSVPSLAVPPSVLRAFGRALFGCAPENLPNLTPQQRAHCPAPARPDASAVIEPPSHVKDPERRAAEMAAKNTPGRIPCTSITSAPAPYGAVAPAPVVDPFCVLGGLLHGFKPLSGLAH